jgi:hypothetical protein
VGRAPSGNCAKCSTWRQSLHRDHIIPKFLGGSDDPSNIQLLCANCHEDKTRDDLTGIPLSAAARRKQSEAQRGKKRSPEARANIKAGVRAVCSTDEFREKMRVVWLTRAPNVKGPEKRFVCNECPMATHAGPMKRHIKASGHSGYRLEGTLF